MSVDYLLGRNNQKRYYDLKVNTESDADKKLQGLIYKLDEEDKGLLIASLENSLLLAKRLAKKKLN
ncbi:hypothetical protein ACQKMV_06510 [Lysinibacillus sp. NPDC094403]|uniref:hypothetical protein n=1 Tax=Lysinibacillus sp. NPDC094403 TaxID=3390581 RepID=UPI003D017190